MSDLASTCVPFSRVPWLADLRAVCVRSGLPLGVLVLISATALVGAYALPVLAAAAWYGLKRVS